MVAQRLEQLCCSRQEASKQQWAIVAYVQVIAIDIDIAIAIAFAAAMHQCNA